jgi:hypothetical protein
MSEIEAALADKDIWDALNGHADGRGPRDPLVKAIKRLRDVLDRLPATGVVLDEERLTRALDVALGQDRGGGYVASARKLARNVLAAAGKDRG